MFGGRGCKSKVLPCSTWADDRITVICKQVWPSISLRPLPHSQHQAQGRPEATLSSGRVSRRCYSGHPEATCTMPGAADPQHVMEYSVPGHQPLHPWQAHLPSAAQPPHSHAKEVSTGAVPHWPDPAPPHQLVLHT